MLPPVAQTLSAATAVTAIVSDRIWSIIAPQVETRPYVVWTLVSGVPELNLSDRPEGDDQRVQIDCYSMSQQECGRLAKAVRDAIEGVTHIVFGPWTDYEPDTKLFKWSMDSNWLRNRAVVGSDPIAA